MRRAALLALLLALLVALCAPPVALAASKPKKGDEAKLTTPPTVAAASPTPTAAAEAPPVAGPPDPLPTAAAVVPSSATTTTNTTSATTTASSPCCDALNRAGFPLSPGMPVVVVTTAKPLGRSKSPSEVCACGGSGSSDDDLRGIPVLARVRGGVNTQRYNSIKQFAILVPGLKKEKFLKGADGDNKSEAVSSPSPSSSTFVGLPRGKHFVLIGQVNDTFSLKYWTGLELAARMAAATKPPSDALVVPRARHVELFVVDDGKPLSFGPPSGHYRGVYLLTQHIDPALIPGMKAKKDRKKKNGNDDTNETSPSPSPSSSSSSSDPPLSKLNPNSFISTFLHGERIDPSFSAFVEMPITNKWAGKNKEWAVKYPDAKDVSESGDEGRALLDSISKRYAAVENAIFDKGALGPADFDSPDKVMRMRRSLNASSAQRSNNKAAVNKEAFLKVAHLPTWLDWFLLAEFTKVTKHAYHSAAFMHSLGGEDLRLRFGPAWSYGQG